MSAINNPEQMRQEYEFDRAMSEMDRLISDMEKKNAARPTTDSLPFRRRLTSDDATFAAQRNYAHMAAGGSWQTRPNQ